MRKLSITGALVAALIAAGPTAQAANDGNLGATSTGDIDITLNVPNMAQISGLTDITVNYPATGGDVTRAISFCVFSSTRLYTIRATSANGDGATNTFRLHDSGNYIPYEIDWTDDGGTATNLDHNQNLASQNTNATAVDCGGGTNTSLTLRITEAAVAAVPAASYQDNLTLLVTPQ